MKNMNTLMSTQDESIHQVSLNPLLDQDLIAQIESACDQACQSIAPAWPLDRAIAVNPHWSRIGLSVRQVAARLAVLGDIPVFPSRTIQHDAWENGRIHFDDLEQALIELPAAQSIELTAAQCIAALTSQPNIQQLPLLIDVLDNDPLRHTRLSWRQAITHQVGQTCAAYFDEHQADWQPERSQGLYAFWRDTLQNDHGIGQLMGLPNLGSTLAKSPTSRLDAECWVMQRLGLSPSVWADYLEAVLLTVNGWASWCAYLGWQAQLEGRTDTHLRELLAIRLSWGVILLECKDDMAAAQAFSALQQQWAHASALVKQAEDALIIDEIWQVALEKSYQRPLAKKLLNHKNHITSAQEIDVQAAFCIDVRSEPLRRALEQASSTIQTIGFAGFFGLPMAYTPLATQARRPQLPGLLNPAIEVTDRMISSDLAHPQNDTELQFKASQSRADHFSLSSQWLAASRWPGAAFSYVEAAGISYLGKIGKRLFCTQQSRIRDDLYGLSTRYRALCRPQITGLDLAAKVALAAGVLHAMGLDKNLAPLILLIGHGSQSTNNAHAAALDCGACCGQTGEVNARSLAQLLNEADVRLGLHAQGIVIPEQSYFVAALHNTTTDEIEWFELDLFPPQTQERLARLQTVFAQAGDQVRRERALQLGVNPQSSEAILLNKMRARANDWAQTRPEWGLANNAAFIIAPRHRTRGLDLAGRSFLQDYDASQDTNGNILEMLMTAPMLVTHWINWQYHASTCAPKQMGSGNKLLHNVVGGTIGVFEGNGGDLRIGLSKQSLHDGEKWMHEPLRLTVIIDAACEAIDKVIDKHPVVQQLLNNGWIYLWRFDEQGFMKYQSGKWQSFGQEIS